MALVGRSPIFVAETEVDGEFGGNFPVVVEVAAIVAVADIADEDAAESGGIGVAQEKIGGGGAGGGSVEGKGRAGGGPGVEAAAHPAGPPPGRGELGGPVPSQNTRN